MFPSSSRVFRWNGAKVYSQTEWAHGRISLYGSATDAGHIRICSNRKSATWVQRTFHFRFSAVLLALAISSKQEKRLGEGSIPGHRRHNKSSPQSFQSQVKIRGGGSRGEHGAMRSPTS